MTCTYTNSATIFIKLTTTYLYSPFCAFMPRLHCHTNGQQKDIARPCFLDGFYQGFPD